MLYLVLYMETSRFTFLALGLEDIPEIAALEALSFSTPWSAEQYDLVLRHGACKVFGARLQSAGPDGRAGELAAYIAVSAHAGADEMEVYNIAVAEAYRQQGIGKKLLCLAMQAAAKNGITRAVLEVREHNVPAIALYRSLGFTRAGVRRGYYPDTGEDAHVYVCDLTRQAS